MARPPGQGAEREYSRARGIAGIHGLVPRQGGPLRGEADRLPRAGPQLCRRLTRRSPCRRRGGHTPPRNRYRPAQSSKRASRFMAPESQTKLTRPDPVTHSSADERMLRPSRSPPRCQRLLARQVHVPGVEPRGRHPPFLRQRSSSRRPRRGARLRGTRLEGLSAVVPHARTPS
jgi:hypothetical protein